MSANLIFIGTKPLMNYVTAVVMRFTTAEGKQVRVSSIEILIKKRQ